MSERAPDAIEPLELWRAWRYDRGRLFSVYQDEEWAPGEPYEATCEYAAQHVAPCDRPSEENGEQCTVPSDDCTCGIYALYDPRGLPESVVYGKVNVWGKVIRGSYGARAQYAYPSELHVPEWLEDQEALRSYGVPIVVNPGPAPPEPDPGPAPSPLLSTPTLEQLGISTAMCETISLLLGRPNGAFLVTGPADSGRSTTLFACLSLATAIRSDRDVVMVGETRHRETAKMLIDGARSGHFVLSTMLTKDAPSAITRLTEMGVDPYLTGATVHGVLAQRIARKLCAYCCEMYQPSVKEMLAARISPDVAAATDGMVFYRKKGCGLCNQTGYKGRVAIFQLLVMSEELAALTAAIANREEIERAAGTTGMRTLWDDGITKVGAGLTSTEELARVTA
jgi:Type II/IV secretion system protein